MTTVYLNYKSVEAHKCINVAQMEMSPIQTYNPLFHFSLL